MSSYLSETRMKIEFPVSQAVLFDAEVAQTVRDLQSGALSVCSPTPSMYRAWTPEEEAKLSSALMEVLALEQED